MSNKNQANLIPKIPTRLLGRRSSQPAWYHVGMEDKPYKAPIQQGSGYLNRRRLPLLLLVGVVIGMVTLPEMKSGFIILALYIALHVSIWTFITRFVRLNRERHMPGSVEIDPPA